jgi:hypothetical protein
MSKARSGGGITMSKNVSPSMKTGSPNKATTPAAASQLGQAVSFKREQVESGSKALQCRLGNEVALNVSGGGPGKGREVFRSGSQGTHGPVAQGESPRSAPRGLDVRGRLKGDI